MLDDLRKILPVPATPVDIDPDVAKRNQDALNVQFPDDFLQFGETYGSGWIGVGPYTWKVFSQCCELFPAMVRDFVWINDQMREAQEQLDLPLGLFPEPGGLLPFADDGDRTSFAWKTEGDPNIWTVVAIWAYFEDYYHCYDFTFSEFWYALLTRKTEMLGYRTAWNAEGITFHPGVGYRP